MRTCKLLRNARHNDEEESEMTKAEVPTQQPCTTRSSAVENLASRPSRGAWRLDPSDEVRCKRRATCESRTSVATSNGSCIDAREILLQRHGCRCLCPSYRKSERKRRWVARGECLHPIYLQLGSCWPERVLSCQFHAHTMATPSVV